ncbi:AAA family ATPase [Rhodanobacter umsongensis]
MTNKNPHISRIEEKARRDQERVDKITSGHAANDGVMPATMNAAELMKRQFLPVQWAVRGILPEGVSILSGDPKIGKSWLLYQACIAVAAGRALWAGREPEIQGDTLMLALEDNDRRLQRRLATLLPFFATMKSRQFIYPPVERLHLATEWPRAEDGVSFLQRWLREHPGCRLVVIDTVSAFRKKDIARNKGAYAADYEVGEMFKPLAREFSCAIVLVMHNRKQQSDDVLQMVSGTQGMTGGVDNVLVLRRERGKFDAGLYVDGRDIDEPQEIAMRFSDGYWSSDGQSVDEAKMSQERRRVLAVVAELGDTAKVKAIAAELEPKKYQSVKSLLSKMVKSGDLALMDGLYMCVGTVGTVGTREAA